MAITQAGNSEVAANLVVVFDEEGWMSDMNPIPRQGWRKNGSHVARLDTIVAFYVKAP
ncbi:MAG: hypothetical protein ACTS8S_06720 [Giesbergeria sp.]